MGEHPTLDLDGIRARLRSEKGPRLWRSLEELAGDETVRRYIEAEFPDVAQAGAVDRRTLMRLMGASLALGLAACNDSAGKAPLLSHARNDPSYVPGVSAVFATSLELGGYGRGVLVEAREGRPIKIEGNPLHPASLGATDVFAQAEVLSLYDPDRSTTPVESGEVRSWEALQRLWVTLRQEIAADGGRGLAVVLPAVASPTQERLVAAAQALLPEASWHHYLPIADDNGGAGALMAFGRVVDIIYDLTQADAIVTLGGDLFAFEPGHVRYAADYQARRREAGRPLPRLITVESTPSLIGARADERIMRRPSEVERFAHDLARAIETGSTPSDAPLARAADALRRAGGRGLVIAGREQPPIVHALAHAINARLGAFGTTVKAIEPVGSSAGGLASLAELAQAIAAERLSRLVVLGCNPAYDAPADLELAELIGRVPFSLHLGLYANETAAACRWHVPQRHPLESWGDLRAFDGTTGLCQPTLKPLIRGVSPEEALALIMGQNVDGRALVETTWRRPWGEAFDARWRRNLEAGVIEGSAAATAAVTLRPEWRSGVAARSAPSNIEIVFAPDHSLWDGRYANNGWLQELPKPLTKQVWGNAALIAPDTARTLGLITGDEVDIALDGRVVRGPVQVTPGHAPDCATLPLGYGRSRAGSLGSGIGFNAYRLRTTSNPWIAGATIASAGSRGTIITTQDHHAVDGRDIVRVVAPGETTPDPPPRPTLYPEWRYDGYAWGMAIDLDACIGCNACVVACQAENNVPVVGPEEVARGREMHWLRVDRYYAGDPAEPQTYFQPVPCMHCERAPCEVVCPVNATVHSSEGLNDMVYNRCVGTRTCSNNCPYKVRRFNFLDYRGTRFEPGAEPFNPEVTPRERGVMEKCTFCIQRISAARIEARMENRRVRDGEVVTACQQACPTRAIVFGDINDTSSDVARLKRDGRNYALLGELNTKPRTTYLARVEAKPRGPGDGT